MLTSEIRRELIDLQGFQFTFRGNRDFDPLKDCTLDDIAEFIPDEEEKEE